MHHHNQRYPFKNLLRVCKCVEVRDSLWEPVLFSHYMGAEDRAQVVKLGGMCLYFLSQLAGPSFFETGFCSAAQAGLELTFSYSASPVLGLQACWLLSFLKNENNKVHKRWVDIHLLQR